MAHSPFWSFEHLYFEFVSDFDIRISDFKLQDNSLPNMMLQSTNNYELLATVNWHPTTENCLLFSVFCLLPSKSVENPLQIGPIFLQNKPNFKIGKMNITSATTVNYINKLRTTNYELIMKTNPNKPNSNSKRSADPYG